MSLTTKQEATLKELAAKEDKQKAINIINSSAYAIIQTKNDEIQVLEDKRVADIKALNG